MYKHIHAVGTYISGVVTLITRHEHVLSVGSRGVSPAADETVDSSADNFARSDREFTQV